MWRRGGIWLSGKVDDRAVTKNSGLVLTSKVGKSVRQAEVTAESWSRSISRVSRQSSPRRWQWGEWRIPAAYAWGAKEAQGPQDATTP